MKCNDANRLLFSKSVSNYDKLKYRLDQRAQDQKKEPILKMATTSKNAQTPGSIHSQGLFKYHK